MNIRATVKSVQSGKNGIQITLSDVQIEKQDLTFLMCLVDEKIQMLVTTEEEALNQLAFEFGEGQ